VLAIIPGSGEPSSLLDEEKNGQVLTPAIVCGQRSLIERCHGGTGMKLLKSLNRQHQGTCMFHIQHCDCYMAEEF
jgi:hypothetical protein